MFRNLFIAAAESASGPVVHIVPGNVLELSGYAISNSILYGWISAVVIILGTIFVTRKMNIRPLAGLVQIYEILVEFIFNLVESSLGSREKALKYAPHFTAIFIYVLLSNWLGLIPGAGESLTVSDQPIIRPFTADLNGTLAAAVVIMFYVQYFAIKESGFFNHLKHYFSAGSPWSPLTWFLGIFEMFGELTRIISLALRLFLNVTIGETIIAVFTYLGGYAAPITAFPFIIIELLVGALQAYIFVMLSVMYLSVAISHGDEHEHEEADEPVAKSITTIQASRG